MCKTAHEKKKMKKDVFVHHIIKKYENFPALCAGFINVSFG